MANPLKKTMVYLGLADEELEYDDDEQTSAGHDRAPAPLFPIEPQQQNAAAPSRSHAPVTPLRPISSARNAATQDMNEILTVHPRQYRDAQSIAESFREGVPVIINLSQMSDGDARRLVDFASGLSQGLYGKIERVTSKVFLLSPSHIVVSGEHGAAEEVEASFFAQS